MKPFDVHRDENQYLLWAHALAAGVGGAALAASAIASGFGASHAAPEPFVWRDVALTYFLAALPLAATLVTAALSRLTWSRHAMAVLAVEAAILFVVPQLYVRARCQSDAIRAVGLLEQSRYVEVRDLLRRVLALQRNAQWKGNSLQAAAANLDRVIGQIERRVAAGLGDSASDVQRLERARDLAMLGRTSEAIARLDSSSTLAASPDACILRGTIHETQGQWLAAREWYSSAKRALQPLAPSPERTAGLVQATTGIAFCERKLGRLREAEANWNERLELSPTADSHFLLAQFYEDTQQARQARLHAETALRLAPDRYALRGRQLVDKLVTSHFGCAGVFSDELSPSTPFGSASELNP